MNPLHKITSVTRMALAVVAAPATAGGLRCSLGEVVLENLKIGQTYSLTTLANLPLTLVNTGDQAVLVKIDPLVPGESELKQGAEPLPSAAWAFASPETLQLEPGESGQTELTISIPDDEKLFGRRFQIMFWSHTLPVPGQLLAVGLKSRVIFSVDTEREDPGVTPRGAMGIEFVSSDVEIDRVKGGKSYKLEEASREPLTIRNTSDRTLEVAFEVLPADAFGAKLEPDQAELLDAGSLELSATHITLEPGEQRTIEGTLLLERAKVKGRKTLTCVIAAAVTNQQVTTRILSRVFARPS